MSFSSFLKSENKTKGEYKAKIKEKQEALSRFLQKIGRTAQWRPGDGTLRQWLAAEVRTWARIAWSSLVVWASGLPYTRQAGTPAPPY